jgi:glycogen debranching enzyme
MHRVQPHTQKGYLLVAHTAFSKGSKDRGYSMSKFLVRCSQIQVLACVVSPVKLRRTRCQFVFGTTIDISSYELSKDTRLLRGLTARLTDMATVVVPQGLDTEGPYSEVVVPDYFPPGSIMVFETRMQGLDIDLEALCSSGALKAFGDLDLVDLNVVLYRTDSEERDATQNEYGAYDIPGLGISPYCGLEGWLHPLKHIMRHNDLGHPLCAHLRAGTWALDYVHQRLERYGQIFCKCLTSRDSHLIRQCSSLPNLTEPTQWFKERFDRVKAGVPPTLRPKYFALVISEAYKAARQVAVEQMSSFVSNGHKFTHDLALCSVQMHGLVLSASLCPDIITPSLAAGLPHFATSWARCWGRDVFISLRGLFVTTGNFVDARRHVLAFASTLKHGLIPNLLGSGRNPR